MAQKKIIIEPEITIDNIRLIPLAELTIKYYYGNYGIYYFVQKNPVAVILIIGKNKKLFLLDESSSTVDKLLAEVPQLSTILNS
jgi:hypothetical protein